MNDKTNASNITPSLIKRLLEADAYPHEITPVQLIETHISWVLLTGEFAYKIKKPVNFGFLDFSTLEQAPVLLPRRIKAEPTLG